MSFVRLMAETSIVSHWFGSRFGDLHPTLQALHLRGGKLTGTVEISTGTGIAGWLGRRLAKSLGIPVDLRSRGFAVEIRHTDTSLFWLRRFDSGFIVKSRFMPMGVWTEGYWVEETGALKMRLTIDVVQGGWEWRPLRASFKGIRLPMWLLPQSKAGKRIINGRYLFNVEFALPILGLMLSYGGQLVAEGNGAASI
jgi:hypothetical protein